MSGPYRPVHRPVLTPAPPPTPRIDLHTRPADERGPLLKLKTLLRRADATEHAWLEIEKVQLSTDLRSASSLQALAALVEAKALAARHHRDTHIVPLCGHVDRRRKQIVQALEDRNVIQVENRQLRGQLEGVLQSAHALEADRHALSAAHQTSQSRAAHLTEERGRLKQRVATLEEKILSEHMVAHKLRGALAEASVSVDSMSTHLSLAVLDSDWARSYAHHIVERMGELDEECTTAKGRLVDAQHTAALTHGQLADAQEAALASTNTIYDLRTQLSAANIGNDDLKSQLIKASAAKSALSDRVDTVLTEMDTHNRELAVAVETAEKERERERQRERTTTKNAVSEMPELGGPHAVYTRETQRQRHIFTTERDALVDTRQEQAVQLVSVRVRLEPSVGQDAPPRSAQTATLDARFAEHAAATTHTKNYTSAKEHYASAKEPDNKENTATSSTGTKTPKAALRKRLLEARNALGGVKLGAAPKRSISFHPAFVQGVCDDDLV